MHRLVQLATQDWPRADSHFERWGSQFMINLNEAFPDITTDLEDFDLCRSLLPHVFAAMDIELHDRNPILRQASVLAKAALQVHGTGAYADSRKMYEQALKIWSELLGPDHIETIRLMQSLGVQYISTQNYESAESILEETLNQRQDSWETTIIRR